MVITSVALLVGNNTQSDNVEVFNNSTVRVFLGQIDTDMNFFGIKNQPAHFFHQ